MNDFDCSLQVEDSRDYDAYLSWVEYQESLYREEQEELNAWYDSHRVITDDLIEDIYLELV